MVLSTQVGLNTLASLASSAYTLAYNVEGLTTISPLVYVLAGSVTAYEADGLYRGGVADGVHSRHCTMYDVEHTRGEASPLAEFRNNHGRSWITLGRLENESVASGNSHRNGPQRNHPVTQSVRLRRGEASLWRRTLGS